MTFVNLDEAELAAAALCQTSKCDAWATVLVRYPPYAAGLDDFVLPYCAEHASWILDNPDVWPGARIESKLGSDG